MRRVCEAGASKTSEFPSWSLGTRGFFLFVVALVAFTAKADQTPTGDFGPQVSVQGGCFAVTFCNHRDAFDSSPPSDITFRSLIGEDGKILSERQPVPPYQIANTEFTTAGWVFDYKKEQFHVVSYQSRALVASVTPIWLKSRIGDIGLEITEYHGSLFCHLSSWITDQILFPFYLAKANQFTGLVETVELGTPARSGMCANVAASNIHIVEDMAYIAWAFGRIAARPENGDPNDRTHVARLVLSRWNLSTGSIDHFFLPGWTQWSSNLSINTIGDKMLIAWDAYIPGHQPGKNIRTLLLSLSKLTADHSHLLPIVDFDPQISSYILP